MGVHILRSEHTKSNVKCSDLYLKLFCILNDTLNLIDFVIADPQRDRDILFS